MYVYVCVIFGQFLCAHKYIIYVCGCFSGLAKIAKVNKYVVKKIFITCAQYTCKKMLYQLLSNPILIKF